MHTTRIMLVEENRDVRNSITLSLRNQGFQVATFRTGERALTDCGDRLTDFGYLITEYDLPGCDGLQMARYVKARHPSIGVIVVTKRQSIPGSSHLPFDRLLYKPFAVESLIEALGDIQSLPILKSA